MEITLNKFFLFLVFIFPLLLIAGPAAPDIILTLFVIFYLIKFLLYKNYKVYEYKWFIIGLIYCFGAIISSFLAYDFKIHSISSSLPYVRFILFCFLLNYFILKLPINYFVLIHIIAIAIFFVSIDICIQYYYGKDIFGFASTAMRNSGPFGEELKGGSYISKLFFPVFSIFYFNSFNNKIYNIILPIFFITFLFALIFSGERTSIIIFIICSFIFFSLIYYRNIQLYFLILLSLILIFIISYKYFLDDNLKERYFLTTFNDIKNFESIIDSHYGAHYITAYNIFLDYPINGVGQNNYRNICIDKKYSLLNSARIKDRCSTHPHNYYIEILSDLGIINFFIFILLVLSLFYQVFCNRNQTHRYIYYGKIISLIVIFWPFLPTGSFYNNWNSCVNWLIIALSICLVDKSYSDKFFAFLKNKKDVK